MLFECCANLSLLGLLCLALRTVVRDDLEEDGLKVHDPTSQALRYIDTILKGALAVAVLELGLCVAVALLRPGLFGLVQWQAAVLFLPALLASVAVAWYVLRSEIPAELAHALSHARAEAIVLYVEQHAFVTLDQLWEEEQINGLAELREFVRIILDEMAERGGLLGRLITRSFARLAESCLPADRTELESLVSNLIQEKRIRVAMSGDKQYLTTPGTIQRLVARFGGSRVSAEKVLDATIDSMKVEAVVQALTRKGQRGQKTPVRFDQLGEFLQDPCALCWCEELRKLIGPHVPFSAVLTDSTHELLSSHHAVAVVKCHNGSRERDCLVLRAWMTQMPDQYEKSRILRVIPQPWGATRWIGSRGPD
jgi:hypothetical protein